MAVKEFFERNAIAPEQNFVRCVLAALQSDQDIGRVRCHGASLGLWRRRIHRAIHCNIRAERHDRRLPFGLSSIYARAGAEDRACRTINQRTNWGYWIYSNYTVLLAAIRPVAVDEKLSNILHAQTISRSGVIYRL